MARISSTTATQRAEAGEDVFAVYTRDGLNLFIDEEEAYTFAADNNVEHVLDWATGEYA